MQHPTAAVRRRRVIAGGCAAFIFAPITLEGLPKGIVTVRIAMRTKSGTRVVDTRRYRACAPKRERR